MTNEYILQYVDEAMEQGYLFYNNQTEVYFDSLAGITIPAEEMGAFLEKMAIDEEWYSDLVDKYNDSMELVYG